MKLTDIDFVDEAFKACVLETAAKMDVEDAEDIVELRCRKQGIESAAGIEYLTGLKLLDLTRNELSKLDLSKNVLLEEVFVGNNELASLNVSGCTVLTHLEVFINELDELDLSNNILLEELYANKNDLETIDLSHNKELIDVRLSGNELSDLDLAANAKLQRLELEKNPLTEASKAMMAQLQNTQIQL
jgi:Leucine-rich repeat (LRR) protein